MLNLKFIEYIILVIILIPSCFLTYVMIMGLARSAVDGHRGKFFIKLLITSFLIGFIYAIGDGIFTSIKIEKITKEYNELSKTYELVSEDSWSDNKNVFIKNQLLYNFYHKNNNGEICEDLKYGVTNDLKNEMDKVKDFKNSKFAKESIEICEVTNKYRKLVREETCATKENGVLCLWMNPIFKKLNTKFTIFSIEPPAKIEENIIKEENPLDKE